MSEPRAIPLPPEAPNFYTSDRSLQRRLRRFLDHATFTWAEPFLAEVADKNRPVLRVRNARGERIDEIVYHPVYLEMSRIAYSRLGLGQMVHRDEFRGRRGRVPRVVGVAAQYLFAQAEQGLMCPIIMTDCIVRSIARWGSQELKDRWLPRLTTLRPTCAGLVPDEPSSYPLICLGLCLPSIYSLPIANEPVPC